MSMFSVGRHFGQAEHLDLIFKIQIIRVLDTYQSSSRLKCDH